MKRLSSAAACLALAACGTPEPLMTPQSTTATKAAIDACIARKTNGQSLSQLTAKGFTQSGNRYIARIENPKMVVGGSIIRAQIGLGQSCIVTSEPVLFEELPVVQRLVREAVANASRPVDETVQYNQAGAIVRVTFR